MSLVFILAIVILLSGCGDVLEPQISETPKSYCEYVEHRASSVCEHNLIASDTEQWCRHWLQRLKECEEKKQ